MRAQLKEEKGNVAYQIQIDPEKMEAHKISVIPDYMFLIHLKKNLLK